MHPLETYLKALSEIQRTGGATAETSFYGAIEALLNEVGQELKPRVRAVAQLKDTGAGQPDFGLYTANQFHEGKVETQIPSELPERGVVEVKGWVDDSFVTAGKEQITRYWRRYSLVLVTNYRDFVLVGRDPAGNPLRLETYRLAESEAGFYGLLAQPRKAAEKLGERFLEFIRRVLLYESVLCEPEDLAWFLASYAREARRRVEDSADLLALGALKRALEEALGMKFEGEKGEHFFQATFVQTLFYGIFSSWVLWSRDARGAAFEFDWRRAAWTLHVPMVAGLFYQIATPDKLRPLKIDEVLDWAGAALNRVDRPAFFARFEEEHAVQYFYEPFLQAYDPELRKELGVWYTPPEIVKYQVERVDTVLREELGIADGLADEQVLILDPCCGTGAYLVETIKRIHQTLEEKGGGGLTAQKLKKAARERVFGFEILPAPFVVSHLQLGLMLRRLGAPLDHETNERVGVYLTNALTGWEPIKEPKNLLPFPELMEERKAANRVKQDAPILVILGNPPYNAFAGTSPEEEGGLVDAYKEGLTTSPKEGGWGIKKFNLDDLYVRFFRIAERRIAKSGKGVVSYISNFSYLGDPSFVVMRRRLLNEFDKLWFDCMNGDSRETGKLTPEGKPDPSVFSTERTKVGIRVGTAVCVLVRKSTRMKIPAVRFRHFWGVTKRRDLLASIVKKNFEKQYEKVKPKAENRYSFHPTKLGTQYMKWPRVIDLAGEPPSNGLMEKRGGALIDIDRGKLEKRMKAYFNRRLDWEEVHPLIGGLADEAAGFHPKKVRERALGEEHFESERILRYAIRPFDTVWCYYSSVPGLWNRSRPSYFAQCWKGNRFFMTRPSGVAQPEGIPVCFTSLLGDNDFQRGHSYYFPMRIRVSPENGNGKNNHQPSVFEDAELYATYRANLSDRSRKYLGQLGFASPDNDPKIAELIWLHSMAIGHSPAYLSENADGVRQDWPRIPLPASKQALLDSAALGERIAAILDTETPLEGVTSGKLDARLRSLGVMRKVGAGAINPVAGDLDLTVGWGRLGKDGARMPGRGRTEDRPLSAPIPGLVEGATLDIYLNSHAYWSDVPPAVWDFAIGGYQVLKKWLSYREKSIIGRGLTLEEAEYVTEMVRRIACLVLLRPELDENYLAVKESSREW